MLLLLVSIEHSVLNFLFAAIHVNQQERRSFIGLVISTQCQNAHGIGFFDMSSHYPLPICEVSLVFVSQQNPLLNIGTHLDIYIVSDANFKGLMLLIFGLIFQHAHCIGIRTHLYPNVPGLQTVISNFYQRRLVLRIST